MNELSTTPKGKRRAQIVTHDRGVQRMRWYVSGRRYRSFSVSAEIIEASKQWVENGFAIVRVT